MDSLSTEWFKRFAQLIYQHSGIQLDQRKQSALQSRITKRMKVCGLQSVERYYRMIKASEGHAERLQLLDIITTNETFFFRTESHFDWFRSAFLTEVIRRKSEARKSTSLRIWSAACSNGAEPYSLSICLAEQGLRLKTLKTSVLGTDLSESSLREAKRARYKARSIENISEDRRRRYFRLLPESPEFELRPRYRESVRFRSHNLMEPIDERAFDCIFLRNVLIYFDRVSKQTVLNNVTRALDPGGYLVIGPSEGIFGLKNSLTKIETFLYQKPA